MVKGHVLQNNTANNTWRRKAGWEGSRDREPIFSVRKCTGNHVCTFLPSWVLRNYRGAGHFWAMGHRVCVLQWGKLRKAGLKQSSNCSCICMLLFEFWEVPHFLPQYYCNPKFFSKCGVTMCKRAPTDAHGAVSSRCMQCVSYCHRRIRMAERPWMKPTD